MKPGDKVWYFDNYYKVILSAIIKEIGYNYILAYDTHTGMLISFNEHTLPFESREALCEHYRKIFE